MKKIASLFSIFLLCSQLLTIDLDARGGRGGGRSGGGAGTARSVQRSPSMSRSTRPASVSRPQLSQPVRPASAPSYASSQAWRAPTTTPRLGGQTETRSQVQQFIKTNPTNLPAQQVTRPSPLPSRDALGTRPGTQGKQGVDSRVQNAGQAVRGNISSRHPNRSTWFNRNFWDQHHYRPSYYSYPGRWWTPATATSMGAWLGWNSQPYYYENSSDYGSTNTYWGTTDPTYADTYTPQQVNEIAMEEETAGSIDWMPLGVFAIAKNTQSVASPNMFVQLALSKSGVIAGTLYNSTTDQTYELAGMVDHGSQRAAWKIADNDASPMVETGAYNLTMDESPIRIYFPNGSKQDMLLVRVPEF
ncbi:MAG: hypothetical protein H0T62_11495 [Parachlamydiaceae bacterium]|nr:hypothetical protein [Parachlamydiaceae bacterium]